jgi:pimeloyl-ACP methyl ester carboxylesterase
VFLVTLHGFWGNGSDLAPISEALRQANLVDRSWGPDLLVPGPLSPDLGFSEWTESFANELRRRAVGSKVMAIGYSMGGRLLLHVLKSHPELFRGAVIVSSQPQLQTVEEVRERKLWELNWDLAFQVYSDSGIVYVENRPYMISVMIQGKSEDQEENELKSNALMKEIGEKTYEYISKH